MELYVPPRGKTLTQNVAYYPNSSPLATKASMSPDFLHFLSRSLKHRKLKSDQIFIRTNKHFDTRMNFPLPSLLENYHAYRNLDRHTKTVARKKNQGGSYPPRSIDILLGVGETIFMIPRLLFLSEYHFY